MNTRTIIFTGLLLTVLFTFSCSKKRNPEKETSNYNKKIDDYITHLIQADEIPGMAIAVIQNGQIIHKKNYGFANLAHKVPVTDSTLFRVYSTSKLITSVAIFQLIESGKLSLDDDINNFIDNLPDTWNEIKIKHLLSHSSGLPEYKDIENQVQLSDDQVLEIVTKKSIQFEKGSKYSYNQTNFWFLKLVVEKVTGKEFEKFVKENQFNSEDNKVVYASNSLLVIPNRVPKYQFNKKHNAYEISSFEAGERSLAGNGLNTNLESLINWNKKLDDNTLITSETKAQMITPFNFQNSDDLFGYSWGIFGPENKKYYGFPGGGVSAFMKFVDHDLTIIILSNGFKSRPVISNVITYVSGLVDSSLIRKERMLNEDIRLEFILNNYDDALKKYNQIKADNKEINFERALNTVGYHYLLDNKIDKALSIFKFYTKEYPNSANAFDSLGEAYFMNKQYKLAQQSYEESLRLNPDNKNALKMLDKIEKLN
ncbi:hypothetical protein ATO12_18020 [Aquimarina atlantica]|uniref:Beta-lactamase-related domain-containing protein n=1 Tax=Aquimarina atlantica TaxID=1317122 RepID=A0A023BV66_9FLAO|nr:serine hydrolase domain-containing protein [Aquimarina atlantica]EZH73829.1 hypothetical protein ATO12_18020 [Aquimarina atlantica]